MKDIIKDMLYEIDPKVKKRQKWFKIGILILILVSILLVNIFLLNSASFKQKEEIRELQQYIKEKENIKHTDKIIKEHLDYVNTHIRDIDFEKLKEINKETYGWIQLNGTKVNYPFLKTNNNDYYQSHSFYRKNNNNGWAFIDYNTNLSDNHIIIYGINNNKKEMFGDLKRTLSKNWFESKTSHFIKILTEEEMNIWKIYSVYKSKELITKKTFNQTELSEFLNTTSKASIHSFNENTAGTDKVLTITTHLDKNEYIVIHALLIK